MATNNKETSNTFKHLNKTQREVIQKFIDKGYRLVKITEVLGISERTISREIKRNRYPSEKNKANFKSCPLLNRYPYVCNACKDSIYCTKQKMFFYDYKVAQDYADYRLKVSRQGVNLTEEEFKDLDELVKDGTSRKDSIYHIIKGNPDKIRLHPSTVYRYVSNGYLSTSRLDLPRAVSYKKRKKSNKKYDYSLYNSHIDRSNRTYIDFLSFINDNPMMFGWQADFLGTIKSDSKTILTLVCPRLQFCLIRIFNYRFNGSFVNYLNNIEKALGIETFKKVFPYILGDRDPAFNDYEKIESDPSTGEIRTRMFYCDPYVSNQKGNIENLNNQLRRYFPKGESIERYTPSQIRKINHEINHRHLRSLSGARAYDAFISVYGHDIYNKIMNI